MTDRYVRMITSNPGFANRFDLVMDQGSLTLVTNGGAGMSNTAEALGSTFNDGAWHHLVAIREGDDAASAKLFVDGQELAHGAHWEAGARATRCGLDHRARAAAPGSATWMKSPMRTALSTEDALGLFAAAVPEPSVVVLLLSAGRPRDPRTFEMPVVGGTD